MSWESDVIDDLITVLQRNGGVRAYIDNETSILKGMTEDWPANLGANRLPAIRVTWTGTTEEDEPGTDYGQRAARRREVNFNLHVAVQENNESERLNLITNLCEKVINALYDAEDSGFPNLNIDEINVRSIDYAPDVLFAPFGLAVIDVGISTYQSRTNRAGKN